MSSPSEDPRVIAIRADRKVGRGSCSSIDEAMTDKELVDAMNEENIHTPTIAIQWARKRERLWLEQGTNRRWGSDDDPQLETLRRFEQE